MIVSFAILAFLLSVASSFHPADSLNIDENDYQKGMQNRKGQSLEKPRPAFLDEYDAETLVEGNGHHRVLRRSGAGTPSIIVGNLGQVAIPHNSRSLAELLQQGDEAMTAQASEAALNAIKDITVKYLGGRGSEQMVAATTSNQIVVDPDNKIHYRFTEAIRGLRVDNAALVMHCLPNGTVYAVNGEFIVDDNFTVVPKINSVTALDHTLKAVQLPGAQWESQQTDLRIVYALDGVGHLAWFNVLSYTDSEKIPQREQVYISALTGEIVIRAKMTWSSNLRTRRTVESVVGDHGSDSQSRQATKPSRSLTAGVPSVVTLNCFGNTSYCTVVSRSSSRINTGDAGVDWAHNNAIATYEFYYKMFGRDSVDGKGMTLISWAHFGTFVYDAFWDHSRMIYGDGYGGYGFDPYSVPDIVGHEFTHGVTDWSSGLYYYGESGALNEALSDIVGAGVDRQEGASITDTFLNGEKRKRGANRDYSTPSRYGQPDWYPNRYIGPIDSGGAHINSGIANLAFYLSVMGGKHPQNFSTVVVPAMNGTNFDTSLAEAEKIFYRANTACLTPVSDFATMRYCTADIHGGKYKNNMKLAWDAVGVPNYEAANYPRPPAKVLTNGATLSGQNATTGTYQQYNLNNITAGRMVTCRTTGNNGDADIYVRFRPRNASIECIGRESYSNESCVTGAVSVASVAQVFVHAYYEYSRLSIQCFSSVPRSLTNGVALARQSAGIGTVTYYRLRGVNRHQTVTCSLTGTSGSADLFLAYAHGAVPLSSSYSNICQHTAISLNKSCKTDLAPIDNSDLYVTLSARQAYTTTIRCTKSNPIALTKGVYRTGQRGSTGKTAMYMLGGLSAGSAVTCTTSGPNGDADLYVRLDAPPFLDGWMNDCSSKNPGSNESCTTGVVPSGITSVYVAVHANSTFNSLSVGCYQ